MPLRRSALVVALAAAGSLLCAACTAGVASTPASTGTGVVVAVGAENEYANVIAQIGGKYVRVSAIDSNPNTDPHAFETSAADASAVAAAELVVQNGLGYDTYMNRLESGSPSQARKVIDVQDLLGLPDSTPNPHLWYWPRTMPRVAKQIATDLSALRPAHARYFWANEAKFEASLRPWLAALRQFSARYTGTPVAVTEPVGDYLLNAAGAVIKTPFGLQADIMNGVDPAPQYLSLQANLLAQHKVRVLVYNQQVTDSLTASFLAAARRYGIPVVGVYETMPAGYSYGSWMLAEVNALRKAVADHVSTEKL